jgi:predicted phosphodiesterase
MPKTKFCPGCNTQKPATLSNFHKDGRLESGLRARCIVCSSKTVKPFERTVTLFDVHVPEHDPKFWAALLKWLSFVQPDRIIIGGDFAEGEAVSSHGGNPHRPKLKSELAPVRRCLTDLRNACLKALIDYLEGNHETRLSRYIAGIAPALVDCIDLPGLLELPKLNINWIPENEQPIRIGKTKILHGHQLVGNGGLYPAKKLVESYGEPGVTVICGHFHRTQIVEKAMDPEPAVGMVMGCGRTLKPAWQHGSVNGWTHNIGVIDVLPDQTTLVKVIPVKNGKLVWGDKVFQG